MLGVSWDATGCQQTDLISLPSQLAQKVCCYRRNMSQKRRELCCQLRPAGDRDADTLAKEAKQQSRLCLQCVGGKGKGKGQGKGTCSGKDKGKGNGEGEGKADLVEGG